jgi:hypothetical protein
VVAVSFLVTMDSDRVTVPLKTISMSLKTEASVLTT